MSVMGVTSPKFSVPVCNSFKAEIRKDQLCYTVDPNIYRVNDKPLELTLLLDYNEEREKTLYNDATNNDSQKQLTLTVEETEKRFIIVETIGQNCKSYNFNFFMFLHFRPLETNFGKRIQFEYCKRI